MAEKKKAAVKTKKTPEKKTEIKTKEVHVHVHNHYEKPKTSI